MKAESLTAEQLQRLYLFNALDDQQLEIVRRNILPVSLEPKQILFEAGQPAEYFYFLAAGQIKLYSLSAEGDEKVIEVVWPGETFAEAITFMPQHTFPVNAEAIQPSQLYAIRMNTFRKLLNESPATCMRLLADMSRRLRSRINEIGNLTLHNATYRLVMFLLEQIPAGAAELKEIHLGTPKTVIASRLSIQPETFSRILGKLSRQGLIQVHGNDITLLDVEGLRALL